MDHCKYCGCLALFFRLNKNGLCATCQHMVTLEVGLRKKTILEAAKEVENTLNPQSKITGLDLMAENLGALKRFEERGIPTVEGSPAKRLDEARHKRQGIVLETARAELQELLVQVEKVTGLEPKRRLYSNFLLRVEEYKKKLEEPGGLDEIERQIRRAVQQVQLDSIVRKAMEAESAGKKEAAVELYREAASFLKTAEVDDAYRTAETMKLNTTIKMLGGKPGRPGKGA